MATSGSVDFTQTRNQIIMRALRLIRVASAGQVPSAEDVSNAAVALNAMIKHWAANPDGTFLWLKTQGYVFLQPGTTSYSIGSTGTHASTSYVRTTTASAASIGATSVTLVAGSAVAIGDNIGITGSDGLLQWRVVQVVSTTTVTFATPLTSAVSAGAVAYIYTTRLARPLKILNQWRRSADGTDIQMKRLSRERYQSIPNKNASRGTPVSLYYDHGRGGTGILHVWPVPDNAASVICLDCHRAIEDLDAMNNEADFPQEWLQALSYNLAVELIPEFGINPEDTSVKLVISRAATLKAEVMAWDRENAPFQLVLEDRY